MRPARWARGAGFSHPGDKLVQEDAWALAEVRGGVIAAVADGMSDPTGAGLAGASGALAEVAVAAFVETASRRAESGSASAEAMLREAFEAAERAARATSARAPAGAAFVGAWLGDDGDLAVLKVGDCRAFAWVDGAWQLATARDDADRDGGLTAWLGRELAAPPVIARRGVESLVLATDGCWRLGAPREALAEPFRAVRDLIARARRGGETDNLTAVALVRVPQLPSTDGAQLAPATSATTPARGVDDAFSVGALAVGAILFFVAGLLAAALWTTGGAS